MNSKRENNQVLISVSTLVLDIEGTISSISFVKDKLFPYVRDNLETYIDKNWCTEDFQELLKALKTQALEDEAEKIDGVIKFPDSDEKDVLKKATIDNILWLMDNDRKTKSLKDLQGFIMEDGYKKGDLKGHVYDDVEPCLRDWNQQDKQVFIYSSGSVHAQKLLFGHSEKGDLLPFIKGHFDTTVGMKGDPASYKKILSEISHKPSEVAFLTDVPKEAKAAKEVGIFSILVSRDGNQILTEDETKDFPVIHSFAEIEFDQVNKKRKTCNETDVNIENKNISMCVLPLKEDKPNDPNLAADSKVMEIEESSDELKSKENDEILVGASVSANESMEQISIKNNITVEKQIVESSNQSNDQSTLRDLKTPGDNDKKETIINDNTDENKAVDIKPNYVENQGSNEMVANSLEMSKTGDVKTDNSGKNNPSIEISSSCKDDDSCQILEENVMFRENESKIIKEVSKIVEKSPDNKFDVSKECDKKNGIKPESCDAIETKETTCEMDCPQEHVTVKVNEAKMGNRTCENPETNEKPSDEDGPNKTNGIKASKTREVHQESGKVDPEEKKLNTDQGNKDSFEEIKTEKLSKESADDLKSKESLTEESQNTSANNLKRKESFKEDNQNTSDIKFNKKEIDETVLESNSVMDPKQIITESKEQISEKNEEKYILISNCAKSCIDIEKNETLLGSDVEKNKIDEPKEVEISTESEKTTSEDISKTTLTKNGDDPKQPQPKEIESKGITLKENEMLTNGNDKAENGTSSPVHNGISLEAKCFDDDKSQMETVVEA